MRKQQFGGEWTENKLECIEKYLKAYMKIMTRKKYKTAYIDAFAGTGYRELFDKETNQLIFPELIEQEPESFLAGSIQRALEVKPSFDKYIFIERDKLKCDELQKIIQNYPVIIDRIDIKNIDANVYLSDLCRYDWSNHRAVLFLDPFGMQVKWSTIESIAQTQAIDMWLLFPLGIGVSRLLKKDGQIKDVLKNKLDDIFGTKEWFNAFYKVSIEKTLFGNHEVLEKDADFNRISEYFVDRLKTIFAKVASNPAKLFNSKNIPLFLLCFAAGNPKGAETAVKIAEDILKRI